MITYLIIAILFALIGIVLGWKFSATFTIESKTLLADIEKEISDIKERLNSLK